MKVYTLLQIVRRTDVNDVLMPICEDLNVRHAPPHEPIVFQIRNTKNQKVLVLATNNLKTMTGRLC